MIVPDRFSFESEMWYLLADSEQMNKLARELIEGIWVGMCSPGLFTRAGNVTVLKVEKKRVG